MPMILTPGSISSDNSDKNVNSKKAEIITVASGKGGVGKTLFSINFAIEAKALGKKILLMDADLGLANVHIMAGVYPEHDLMDVMNSKKDIKDIIVKGPGGIDIIPGASGIFQLSNMTHNRRQGLVQQLTELEDKYDLIIIDTEAGISHNVIKFISIADRVVIVTTPDLTALADAYATIKVVVSKKANDNIGVVVNRVKSASEANMIFRKISMAADKFLDFKLRNYSHIMEDAMVVREAIQDRKPIALHYSKSRAGSSIKEVFCTVFRVDQAKPTETKAMFNRFSKLLENMRAKQTVSV